MGFGAEFILWIFLYFIRESGMWIWLWRDRKQGSGDKNSGYCVLACCRIARTYLVSTPPDYEIGKIDGLSFRYRQKGKIAEKMELNNRKA